MKDKKKKRFGDRNDGYLLRKIDHFFRLIPHIMSRRSDAQVFMKEQIILDECESLIRKLRREGYRIGFLHIMLACLVRTLGQKPKLNRFIAGKKIYARKHIAISLAVKKQMTAASEETFIKLYFDPKDTIYDIIDKLNKEILLSKKETETNMQSEKLAKLFGLTPNFLLGLLTSTVKILDYCGLIPEFILRGSPFHSSVFISDLGSLGSNAAYHHIYDFGTTSLFVTFGTKMKRLALDADKQVIKQKVIDIRFVADERIVDGFNLISALKYAKHILARPDILCTPPEKEIHDDQI